MLTFEVKTTLSMLSCNWTNIMAADKPWDSMLITENNISCTLCKTSMGDYAQLILMKHMLEISHRLEIKSFNTT